MSMREIDGPTPYEVTSEQEAQIEAMTEQADRDVEELRVNMRWGKPQVELIKRAAALYGMPYQTYVKQAALRQAIADLRDVEAVTAKRR